MSLDKIVTDSLANGAINASSIAVNSIPSSRLTTTGVVANSYGNSSQIPVFTVDAAGRISNATVTAVAGVTGFSYSGANNTFSITTGDGSTFAANISANSIAALAIGSTGVVANSYGNSSQIPVITIDEDGRISNATVTAVAGVTNFTYESGNNAFRIATGDGSSFAANLPYRTDQNLRTTDVVSFGNTTINGNLTVTGVVTTVNTVNLSVQDNMIYLNANNTVANPDLGFAGNYNDGSYAHAGIFRDATDARWKVFDNYAPEPDASPYIDTANASFHLADLQANVVYANVTGNVTGNVSGSANSATYLGGNTASDLNTYASTAAGTAYTNAVSQATTLAGTAYSNAVSTAASDATTKAGTAYSNAVSQATTLAGTAYSNAVSTAASDATTKAGTAYSNAVSYAGTIAGTAYSNAVSVAATDATNKAANAYANAVTYADNKVANLVNSAPAALDTLLELAAALGNDANFSTTVTTGIGNAYTNAVSQATTLAGTAYSNAVSYAGTIAGTAYTNAASYAATIAGTAYSNATTFASNASNISSGTLSAARLPQANSTSNGAVLILDSVSNTATSIYAAAPNSVKTAYELAGNAVSNAVSYAATAYSNATSYAATVAGTAYSNAVSVAASDATSKAATAYSNATSYAATIAGTAYSNAVSVASSDATSKAATAYSNATSYAATIAGTAYSNATSYAATIAGTAYSNAVSYAASNSYVNSTFLKLAGGTLTGSLFVNTGTSAADYNDIWLGGASGWQSNESHGINTFYSSLASPIIFTRIDSLYDGTKATMRWKNFYYSGAQTSTVMTLTSTSSSTATLSVTGDVRSPIFYDSNDTAYNINLNDNVSGYATTIRSGILIGPNYTWGASLLVGGDGKYAYGVNNTSIASVCTTDGNLHLDASSGHGTYINYYDGGDCGIYAGDSTGTYVFKVFASSNYSQGAGSIRAPIFYDSDDTNYYVDPNSASYIKKITVDHGVYNGSTSAPTVNICKGWTGMATAIYDTVAIQANDVTSIRVGEADGTQGGYCQGDGYNTFTSTSPMRFYTEGTAGNYIYNGMSGTLGLYVTGGSARSPIFYDSDDTAYYTNPASYSYLKSISVGNSNMGSSTYPIYAESAQRYIIGIKNSASASPSNYWWLVHDDNLIFHRDGVGDKFTFSGGGSGTATGDWRAPIFYDSNDTSYYCNPNSSSVFSTVYNYGRIYTANPSNYSTASVTSLTTAPITTQNFDPSAGTTAQFFPLTHQTALYSSGYRTHVSTGVYKDASGWSAGWYMAIGGNDSYPTQWYQLRYDNLITHSDGYLRIAGSTRSPLFYDLDDTNYYIDAASSSGSRLSHLYIGDVAGSNDGSWNARAKVIGSYHARLDVVSNSDSIITTMYSHTGQGVGRVGMTSNHPLALTAQNDITGGYVYGGSLRSPIFYDSDDTGFYTNPSSNSRVVGMIVGGHGGAASDTASSGRLYFGTSADNSYSIYTHMENYGGNYTKLTLDWHTGIKIGAYYGYGGIRFYNNSINSSGTEVFSVAKGDSNVRAVNGLYASIFYDLDNASYYADIAGTSVFNGVQIASLGVGTAASGTAGEIRATNNITAYYSDDRLKTRIGPIENAIEKVKSLTGFYYHANEVAQKLGYKVKREVGLSAQDIQAVLPEIVAPAPIDNRYLTIDYERVVPLLVEAIKEQQSTIDRLEALVNSLINKTGD